MIVKCEQCQTRFKIPDDKVTDKGVKVRCTKCQHTFRVTRDGQTVTAQAPAFVPQPPAAAAPDPFAQFGQAAQVAPEEATRPGMFVPNLASMRPPASGFETDDAPTRVGPMPKDLRALRPPRGPLGLQAPGSSAPPPPQPAAGVDPFGSFGALGAAPLPPTREQQASGVDLAHATAPGWSSGDPFGSAGASVDPFASFGTPAPSPSATQPVQAVAPQGFDGPTTGLPADSAAWTQPQPAFDVAAFGDPPPQSLGDSPVTQTNPAYPTAGSAPAWGFAAPAPVSPQPQSPFDFSGPGGAPPASAVPNDSPFALPGGSMSGAAGPFTDGAFNAGSAPPPPPAPPAAAPTLPPFEAQGFGTAPYGGAVSTTDEEQFQPQPSPFDAGGSADASSLFGAPGSSLSGDPADAATHSGAEGVKGQVGRLNLVKMAIPMSIGPGDGAVAHPTELEVPRQVQPPPEPAAAAEAMAELVPKTNRLAAIRVGANISVAAVLLVLLVGLGTVYLNEGKLELSAISLSRFKDYLSSSSDLVTVDISNGLYETHGGRAVFFVRGEVVNRTKKETRVKVRAEIFDGEQLVRSAQGWAGAIPSPEDLFSIATAEDVERLNSRLVSDARPVPTGDSAQFLVPFYEYPADLKGIRVKVVVVPSDGPEPTANR